jgi:hypothetical protein
MKLNDLVKMYEDHRGCQKLDPKAHAMRVVLAALRDDLLPQMSNYAWDELEVSNWFDRILTNDGEGGER